MDFIKNNWLLLLVLAIAAYLVYKYWQTTKAVDLSKAQGVTNSNFNATAGQVSSNTGSVVNTPPVTTVVSTVKTNPVDWRMGESLYAGSTGANVYDSPSYNGANAKFYNSGQFIGTYLGNQNGYASITIQANVNPLLGMFGYEDIQTRWALMSNLYVKK